MLRNLVRYFRLTPFCGSIDKLDIYSGFVAALTAGDHGHHHAWIARQVNEVAVRPFAKFRLGSRF